MNNEFKEGSIRQKLSGQATSFQFLCGTAEPGMSASGTKQPNAKIKGSYERKADVVTCNLKW
ncbi:hypothetical protein ASE99_21650 [Serratia sp. Leaf51]|nr:hypothetical protein ASE99_21650 [Serratia sp. Leaf51]